MIVDEPARIRYYTGDAVQFESQGRPASPRTTRVLWMEPEGPHTVENIDRHRYHAIRVEFNQHRSENPDTARTTPTDEHKESAMATPDLAAEEVIAALDSFYCHNVVVALWADAVANRLEGSAIYLLSDEIPEVADSARAASRRLADRIGDIGGAVTADPRQLLDRAPGDAEFTIPDCSNPRAIVSYAVQRLNIIIDAYQGFLDKVRGRDDVSFALVVDLLGAETHRRADAEAALAQ